jgi:HlyD family secretion protein
MDDPTRRTVWVLRGKQAEPVQVKLGISDGTQTEVIEGELRPGDTVITEAADPGAAPRGGGPRIRMF